MFLFFKLNACIFDGVAHYVRHPHPPSKIIFLYKNGVAQRCGQPLEEKSLYKVV